METEMVMVGMEPGAGDADGNVNVNVVRFGWSATTLRHV